MEFVEHLYETLNNQSFSALDEELGWIFYPCTNAIEEGLDRSMA